jgi:hypothetical protein
VRFKAPTIRRLIKMLRLLLSICLVMALSPARAAELQGVSMPDQQDVAGIRLILNGIGLRTYSILRIRIYVAGLYLERPNHDAQATLNSLRSSCCASPSCATLTRLTGASLGSNHSL